MTVAVLFPGQGSAAPGCGRPWVDHPSWRVVVEAESVLDRPLARLLLDAGPDELATTEASQMAVLLHSLVAWDALAPRLEARPVAFAGHSLGQITALIAAEVVTRADGLRLAAARATASQESADRRPGCMAAFLGAPLDLVEAVCSAVPDAWVANDNAPGQVVVGGTPHGVAEASAVGRSLGVRRTLALSVGHAFHTPLLADAAEALGPALGRTAWAAPSRAIVTNHDAAVVDEGADGWPDRLRRHLVEPVRWRESQAALVGTGATALVEVGPGSVLCGLARRTLPQVATTAVGAPGDIAAALALGAPDAVTAAGPRA